MLFYDLLRIAVGKSVSLTYIPSSEDWLKAYQTSRKQALLGVCFVGLQVLCDKRPDAVANLPAKLRLQWIANAALVQERNELMDERCFQLQQLIGARGFRSCIFKGQANTRYYSEVCKSTPVWTYRQPGDIDVWIEGGKKRVIDLVQTLAPTREVRETHAQLNVFEDVEVEAHYRPGLVRDFIVNARLQSFFRRHADDCFLNTVVLPSFEGKYEVRVPVWTFDAVHQLTHIYHHFFTEGVGLRQCLDYYFVLSSKLRTSEDEKEVVKMVSSLGMSRFAGALMWVLRTVFDLEEDKMLWNPSEEDGRFLLRKIERGGNFGQYDNCRNFHRMNYLQSFVRMSEKNLSYLRFSPFEWFWGPLWRIYHFADRKLHGFE